MRFFASASAILAMAVSVLGQTPDFDPIHTPAKGEVVRAGTTYEITWSAPPKYKDGTIAISLIGGASQASLTPISEIASGIDNSAESYQWEVSQSLGADALYGLVFTLESDPEVLQYSMPFKIKASSTAPSTSATDSGEGESSATGTPSATPSSKTDSASSAEPTSSAAATTTTSAATSAAKPTKTVAESAEESTTADAEPTKPQSSEPEPTQMATEPSPTTMATTTASSPGTSSTPVATSEPESTPTPTSSGNAGSRLTSGPVALLGAALAMAYLVL